LREETGCWPIYGETGWIIEWQIDFAFLLPVSLFSSLFFLAPVLMFVAQAHSFVQQARLAITLAWVAGYTNIIALLTCGHVTSHLSGTTSDLGRGLAEGRWGLVGFLGFLLLTFFIGAVISGATTEVGRRRGWESIYVLPMAIEAALLAVFALGVRLHDVPGPEMGLALYWMAGCSSMAMGLQNATITRISNGVVRTTHVTGVVTDLGLETVGLVMRWMGMRGSEHGHSGGYGNGKSGSSRSGSRHARRAVLGNAEGRTPGGSHAGRRWVLLLSIICSFALGAGLGTVVFDRYAQLAMFPPVLFLVWIIVQDVTKPIAEIEPSTLVDIPGLNLPKGMEVFRLRKDKRGRARRGLTHRMPDLTNWMQRLPEEVVVVILDLTEVAQLSDNAGEELARAMKRFGGQGRKLLIAGITAMQYEQLRSSVTGEAMGDALRLEDISPDLELAIARGLNYLEDEG